MTRESEEFQGDNEGEGKLNGSCESEIGRFSKRERVKKKE